MIRILIVTAFFTLAFGSKAQKYNSINLEKVTIQTYDGSIYKGYVLDRREFEIDVLLPTMDTISVHDVLISNIKSSNDYNTYKKGRFHQKKGLYAVGFLSADYHSSGGLNGQLVYQTSPKFAWGLTGGFQVNELSLEQSFNSNVFWQLGLYGKYNLTRKSTRIYTDLKAGYGFTSPDTWGDPYEGGIYLEPGIGLQFASKDNFRLNIGLGQQLQRSTGQTNIWNGGNFENATIDYKLWYNRTVLRIGVELLLSSKQQ